MPRKAHKKKGDAKSQWTNVVGPEAVLVISLHYRKGEGKKGRGLLSVSWGKEAIDRWFAAPAWPSRDLGGGETYSIRDGREEGEGETLVTLENHSMDASFKGKMKPESGRDTEEEEGVIIFGLGKRL